MAGRASVDGFIPVSVKTSSGLETLKKELRERVVPGSGSDTVDLSGPQVTRLRQQELVAEALERLRMLELSRSSEFLAEDLRAVCECLDELTGKVSDEDVLERIFSRFCVGK